jgi:hypothetical protein
LKVCSHCNKEVSIDGRVSRRSTCPHCGAALHSCFNCSFYSPGSHNDCKEPQAEFVRDKGASNFCDYFEYRIGGPQDKSAIENKKKNARDSFDKLFG